MPYLMGIDLGTSSVKVLILSIDGSVKAVSNRGYPIDVPIDGFAEQSPELWWKACVDAISECIIKSGLRSKEIKCIGLSGQMHGTVLIDKYHQVIRPAIIHCDQRSKKQVDYINEVLGEDTLYSITLNPLFPGFQVASLLWVMENEPQHYHTTYKVLLPKDFIRLRLTGEVATEYTDASSTMAFDVRERKWSETILSKLNMDPDKFPVCKSPFDIAGYISAEVSCQTGLAKGTAVVMGGADQPMQALGNGAIYEGIVTSTIGTSGQIFSPVKTPVINPAMNTHTFCNVGVDYWYVMGAILNAGLCLKWINENVLHYKDFETLDLDASQVPVCSDGLIFLPYLTGERTPYLNSSARGMFFGLTLKHNGASMARAIMEGVAFALRDCIEILDTMGILINKVIASGGGARSDLWLQIQADVFGREIYRSNMVEQACVGAAITAGVGCRIYKGIEEACEAVVKIDNNPIIPQNKNIPTYNHYHEVYRNLYKRNFDLFEAVNHKNQ